MNDNRGAPRGWHTAECPWCVEVNLYRRLIAAKVPLPQPFEERLSRLQDSATSGLSNDLFLTVPNFQALELTGGSFFVEAPASQSSTFAGVAGALQILRSSGETLRLGPRRFPLSTVINYEEYLIHTYTDSVLRACFVRAAKHDELVYTDAAIEVQRSTHARRLALSDAETEANLAAELLINTALGKFTHFDFNEEVIKTKLEQLGLADLLALCAASIQLWGGK